MLSHVSAGLEHQIQAVRGQLAAAQPLEVALRGTLGAVSTARQTLAKAEQKAAKLEAQVVAAVAAYDAANAEVQAAQKALSEAEAATARTAGGRFDPRLLIGSHPGAALAVLSEAAAARCVIGSSGVDAMLAARVQAAFEEVQRVCRLLPADVPPPKQPEAASTGNSAASSATMDGSAAAAEVQSGEAARGGISGLPHGAAPPANPSSASSPSLPSEAAGLQHHQHQHHLQQHQQLQQQALAQAQAAELARQHAQAALQQAALQAAQPNSVETGAAQPPSVPNSGMCATPAAAGPAEVEQLQPQGHHETGAAEGQGHRDDETVASIPVPPRDDLDHGVGASSPPAQSGASGGPQPKDDDMGGAAAVSIVNKRPASEAIGTARAIAAKAKARA